MPPPRPHSPVPQLVGLTEADARARAAEMGLTVRVLPPGRHAVTLELCPTRVNFVLEAGRVASAVVF